MQSVIKLVSVISLSGVSSVSDVKEWNYEIVRNSGKVIELIFLQKTTF